MSLSGKYWSRPSGRNGPSFEGDTYTTGIFAQTDFDQDIVWGDGAFLRAPQGFAGGT